MILRNGRVYTLDAAVRTAALAITRDGRVARGVEAWEGDASAVSSERIDLDGRTVVPGLADAHVHFLTWSLAQARLRLHEVRSLAECLVAVAERAAEDRAARRDGGWLVGAGWRDSLFADGRPTAGDLDRVTGDRPAALWAHDTHSLWLNSAAMAAGGLGPDSAPPPGGVIERDATGAVTGVLREEAAWQFPVPVPERAERLEAVLAGQRLAHARGVTAVHDMEAAHGFEAWQSMNADRRLTLRVLASQRASRLDAVLACELATGFGDERLQVGPMKAFMDGTLGSRTARMLEPFADGGTGVEITSAGDLATLVRRAAAGGLSVAVHAIGDRANRDALDAFEQTRREWAPLAVPPRIEHAQLLHADDLPRFGRLGVVASMQPSHCPSDRDVADAAWGERGERAYAWRSLRETGAVLANGSDAPIEELDPVAGLHAAVNRTADAREPWRPDEALSPRAALEGFTVGAAAVAGWGDRLGRLAPGCAADLTVLDGDPLTCPPERIGSIRVVATMVGGRWVHGRPPW